MAAESDESIENIDFGGRFARQFFSNNWPNMDSDNHNPISSTPVASDLSLGDSAYESFGGQAACRRPSNSPTTTNQHCPIDINNNQATCSNAVAGAAVAASPALSGCSGSEANNIISTTTAVALPTPATTTFSASSISAATAAAAAAVGQATTTTATNTTTSTIHNNNNNNRTSLTADDLAKLSAGLGLMKLIMTPDVITRQQRSNSLFTTTPAVAASLSATNPWSSKDIYQRYNNVDKIERAASLHRTAASFSEPQYTWSGQLPSRSYKNPVFSCKVFLGGVPWDVTEQGLIETFGRFGPLRVQWPGKDVRQQSGQTKAGYVYLIYETERCVKALLQACTQDFGSGSYPEKYYYQLSSRRMRFKEVQVIPWVQADSNYIRNQSGRPDMDRTVFVGALHGMLTAEGLAKIMNDLFGGVAYVGIDTDKHKYPIGSGRVTFNNQRSYTKAVSAAFVEVKSSQFCKKIQLDPYLGPSLCSTCHIQTGPIYCRDCLRYFCKTCWSWHHSTELIGGRQHRPLMRKKRET